MEDKKNLYLIFGQILFKKNDRINVLGVVFFSRQLAIFDGSFKITQKVLWYCCLELEFEGYFPCNCFPPKYGGLKIANLAKLRQLTGDTLCAVNAEGGV